MHGHHGCHRGPKGFLFMSRRGRGPFGRGPHPPHPPHPPHGPPPWMHEWFGGHRRRAGRGEVRYLILDALAEQPRHGYDVIQTIEQRAGGSYRPSPGTVYPTLQMLDEMGHVVSREESGKRIFEITDEGRADLDAHRDEVEDAYDHLGDDWQGDEWQRFVGLFERFPRLFRTIGRAARRRRLVPAQLDAIKVLLDGAAERIEAIVRGEAGPKDDGADG